MKLLNGWRTERRRQRIHKRAEEARRRMAQHRAEDRTRMPRRDTDHNGSTGAVYFTCG